MLTTLVLVCAASIAPADCSRANALAVVRQPATAGAMCGASVVPTLGSIGFGAGQAYPDAYPKIVCSR